MPLIKCPDCKKMVSDRVEKCPFCGCPSSFFEKTDNNELKQESEENVECGEESRNQHKQSEEEMLPIKLSLCGYNLSFDGRCKEFFEIRAPYEAAAWALRNEVYIKYNQISTIGEIIEKIPPFVGKMMDIMIEASMRMLYEEGIYMTPEAFLEKYYYSYNMDYNDMVSDVIEKYAEVLGEKKSLANYRAMQEASRSKWQGGGFGIGGAVKGAIIAGALNAGTNFVRSFGDANNRNQDNAYINAKLRELRNSSYVQNQIIEGAYECMISLCYALINELQENGVLKGIIYYRKEETEAKKICEAAERYAEDDKDKMDKYMDAILAYPYYNHVYEILYKKLKYVGEEEELFRFMNYFGIDSVIDGISVKQQMHINDFFRESQILQYIDDDNFTSKAHSLVQREIEKLENECSDIPLEKNENYNRAKEYLKIAEENISEKEITNFFENSQVLKNINYNSYTPELYFLIRKEIEKLEDKYKSIFLKKNEDYNKVKKYLQQAVYEIGEGFFEYESAELKEASMCQYISGIFEEIHKTVGMVFVEGLWVKETSINDKELKKSIDLYEYDKKFLQNQYQFLLVYENTIMQMGRRGFGIYEEGIVLFKTKEKILFKDIVQCLFDKNLIAFVIETKEKKYVFEYRFRGAKLTQLIDGGKFELEYDGRILTKMIFRIIEHYQKINGINNDFKESRNTLKNEVVLEKTIIEKTANEKEKTLDEKVIMQLIDKIKKPKEFIAINEYASKCAELKSEWDYKEDRYVLFMLKTDEGICAVTKEEIYWDGDLMNFCEMSYAYIGKEVFGDGSYEKIVCCVYDKNKVFEVAEDTELSIQYFLITYINCYLSLLRERRAVVEGTRFKYYCVACNRLQLKLSFTGKCLECRGEGMEPAIAGLYPENTICQNIYVDENVTSDKEVDFLYEEIRQSNQGNEETKYCTCCGTRILPGAKYCVSCGKEIGYKK